jgi:hypothetical protein
MQYRCTIGNPGTALEAFTLASIELPLNETARRLATNFNAQTALAGALADMGLTRFINLTHNSQDALIAHAMYTGDGIVTKIIPTNYLGAQGAIYHMPSISSQEVKIERRDFSGEVDYESFTIKTYPWVRPGGVDDEDVKDFGYQLKSVNVTITSGDDRPKNIHRLPIKSGRLVGVDSAMFDMSKATIAPELEDGWHNFMHKLYPIYAEGRVPQQSAKTNFDFVSIHDPKMEEIDFSDETGETIVPPTKEFQRESRESYAQALMRHLGFKKTVREEEIPAIDL